MDLYYEIVENGYHIYDRNDSSYHIYQYEPYIPDKAKSYQENAELQIHDLMVGQYATEVMNEAITIDDIPEEYRDEVQAIVDSRPKNPYGLPDDVYAEIISNAEQSYRDKLVQEVSES